MLHFVADLAKCHGKTNQRGANMHYCMMDAFGFLYSQASSTSNAVFCAPNVQASHLEARSNPGRKI